MHNRWLAALLGLLLGSGIAAAHAAAGPVAAYKRLPIDPDHPRQVFAAGEHRIIYMNRNGGTYVPGPDDSSHNMSSIPTSVGTIAPYPYSDASWAAVMQCMQEMYGRFNVTVTDVDPGETVHIESVMGGYPTDVGVDPMYIGYSSLDCTIVDRGVCFTFVGVMPDDPQHICEIAAQETGHEFGLEHEQECHDPMSGGYVVPCADGANMTFQDVDSPCIKSDGSGMPLATCSCTGSPIQNSVQFLYAKVGAGESEPPLLTVTAPTEGQIVSPGFEVLSMVSDNYGIARLELLIDGVFASNSGSPPYTLTAPASLPPGAHALEVVARDVSGNVTRATINIGLIGDCAIDADCPETDVCASGVCLGDVGAPCERNADCAASICAPLGMFDGFCTMTCDPAASSCPSGFDCSRGPQNGTVDKCFPQDGAGCGCRVGRAPLGLGGVALAIGLCALLLRRRRPRARCGRA